jgi:hypothetical protein
MTAQIETVINWVELKTKIGETDERKLFESSKASGTSGVKRKIAGFFRCIAIIVKWHAKIVHFFVHVDWLCANFSWRIHIDTAVRPTLNRPDSKLDKHIQVKK